MLVDVDGELYRYSEQKKAVPRYSSYACDICSLPYDAKLLNPVTIDKAVYFCCADCCEKILLTDYAHLTWEELKRVLGL